MKKLLIITTLSLVSLMNFSQLPMTFKYQAILRDADGKIIPSQDKTVIADILMGSISGTVICSETFNTATNDQGMINLEIGSINTADFGAINWAKGPYFIKLTIDGTEMGTSQLLSVPYSMFAGTVRQVRAPVDIGPDEPIFQVLNSNGDTVFAVYNSGVRVVFDEDAGKGARGGFTVGGRKGNKGATINEYLAVTKDSTIIIINDQLQKGARGGFTVGGRNPAKGLPFEYMNIVHDSTSFFVRADEANPSGNSFNILAVASDNSTRKLLSVASDTTKIGTSLSVARDITTTGNITGGTVSSSTMTDKRDGIIYKVTTIGNQVWMAENLRAEKYINGDPIPYVKIDTAWMNLNTGAFCYYNNDSILHRLKYGGLYNYFAVTDSRKLCPAGWHVPSETEFQELVTYLGGPAVAGGKLKVSGNIFWLGANVGATNSSGFNGMPGGFFPPFTELGNHGYYWSATESSSTTGINLVLNSDGAHILLPTDQTKQHGFSVRCIQD